MLVVDRIEEDTIVVESSNPSTGEVMMQKIPRTWILDEIHEGDVLCKTPDGYAVDETETKKRRAQTAQRLRQLQEE